MSDRRRINGPVGNTLPPVFAEDLKGGKKEKAERRRPADSIRKIYLQTGVTPSASGSAYLESDSGSKAGASGLKLSCTVHGPRALPKSTPFSPHILLTTHVKYAPFATKHRRGYLRDSSERDLSVHLETALRGVIIADRWPKSGVDIIISVIEGDQDRGRAQPDQADEVWGMMNVLSGCITVAAAALSDAGIDCVDTVAGGVAALVASEGDKRPTLVVDPIPSEHDRVVAACCVAYLPMRDEVTNLWFKGDIPASESKIYAELVEKGVYASRQANQVLVACLNETAERT